MGESRTRASKALSNPAEAAFASGSEGLVFKRTNTASFGKEIIVNNVVLFPDYKVDHFASQSLSKPGSLIFQTKISSLLLFRILEEFCVVSFRMNKTLSTLNCMILSITNSAIWFKGLGRSLPSVSLCLPGEMKRTSLPCACPEPGAAAYNFSVRNDYRLF